MLVARVVVLVASLASRTSGLQCVNCGDGVYNINSNHEDSKIPCDITYLNQNLNETSLYCDGVCFTQISKISGRTMSCREQPAQLKSSSIAAKSKYCRFDQLYLVCANQDNCNLEHFVYTPTEVLDFNVNVTSADRAVLSFTSDCQTHDYFLIVNGFGAKLDKQDLLLVNDEAGTWQYSYEISNLHASTVYEVQIISSFDQQNSSSVSASFKTLAETPTTPVFISATDASWDEETSFFTIYETSMADDEVTTSDEQDFVMSTTGFGSIQSSIEETENHVEVSAADNKQLLLGMMFLVLVI